MEPGRSRAGENFHGESRTDQGIKNQPGGLPGLISFRVELFPQTGFPLARPAPVVTELSVPTGLGGVRILREGGGAVKGGLIGVQHQARRSGVPSELVYRRIWWSSRSGQKVPYSLWSPPHDKGTGSDIHYF